MALTACQECKKGVSTDAAACPNCGAPRAKKRGLGTWIVLALTGLAAYQCASQPDDTIVQARDIAATPAPAAPTESDRISAALKLDTKGGRAYLSDRLLEHCQREDRHLNYIKVSTRPSGNGVALYCTHDFYNQYSLSAGLTAPALERWINQNLVLLRHHKVTRVGVWGTGSYASGAWFEVP